MKPVLLVKMAASTTTFGIALLVVIGMFITLNIHVTHKLQLVYHRFFVPPPSEQVDFDFIVVGAGTSGSVVTARLAQAGYQVLLVEAGGPSHWMQGLPYMAGAFAGSPYDWSFKSEPSRGGKANNDERMPVPRGKSLGGSSMLNWNMYMRGHSKDYDEWHEMGNPGWSFQDLLPLFKKSESYSQAKTDKDPFRGNQGEQSVETSAHVYPIEEIVVELMKEVGYPIGDVNGELENEGFTPTGQHFLTKGWRLGAFRNFVEPLLHDPRMKVSVLTYAHVVKVIIHNKVAVGIELERFGRTLQYFASKEVILSSGAIGSPQILMLSGIGPKDHLEQHQIHPIVDLPVGDNLQDHVSVGCEMISGTKGLIPSSYVLANPFNFLRAATLGSGPLTHTGIGLTGFFHTPVNRDAPRPDIQVLLVPLTMKIDFGLGMKKFLNVKDECYYDLYRGYPDNEELFSIVLSLSRPRSRGLLQLRSNNPYDSPIIDPNYLGDAHDEDTLVEALKWCHGLQSSQTFRKYNITKSNPDRLNCGHYEAFSHAYWRCHVKYWSNTIFHHAGTCKMGPAQDPGAVVSPRLQVHGMKNLRVADASIMPKLVGANINAPCLVIGEKAAQMILEDHDGGAKKQSKRIEKDEL